MQVKRISRIFNIFSIPALSMKDEGLNCTMPIWDIIGKADPSMEIQLNQRASSVPITLSLFNNQDIPTSVARSVH